MANERDAEGNMLYPVSRKVIRDPDLRPFMGRPAGPRAMLVVAVQSVESASPAGDRAFA